MTTPIDPVPESAPVPPPPAPSPVAAPPASAGRWLDERLDLSGLVARARERRVPVHRFSLLYHLGGATLFLFGLLVASGILLSLYYRPSVEEAHDSVKYLITHVPFGDLVRSVHVWSAELMIGLLIAHVFTVWLTRAYRPPRELTWTFGTLLLAVTAALGFTGYLLPWNELSYFATRVGTDIAGNVPLIGAGLRRFLRAGDEVSGLTLSRFFGLHVALLPGLLVGLVALHVFLVQRLGVSTPEGLDRQKLRTLPFFPHIVLRDLALWLGLTAVVLSLAAFAPRELGLEADPFKAAPEHIKPEWYFLFVYQTLKILPAQILGVDGDRVGVTALCLFALYLFFLPFTDKTARPGTTRLGWFALAFFVGMTLYGWLD